MCVSIRLCADAFATCVHLHIVHGLSTEGWLFHQCNMLCGSVIRAVGVIDTLPESWLPGVPFSWPSPIWNLSPPPPSRPCKLWLKHFCEVSLSRAHACEGFCVSISLYTMGICRFSCPKTVFFFYHLPFIDVFCHSILLPSLCLPHFHTSPPFILYIYLSHIQPSSPPFFPFPVNTVIPVGIF